MAFLDELISGISGFSSLLYLIDYVVSRCHSFQEEAELSERRWTKLSAEEIQGYRELVWLSGVLLLCDQTPSGSWGNSIETFAEFYLGTYSTSIQERDGFPICPKESPTFQRYAVDALQRIFGSYEEYCPRSYSETCKSIRNRLGNKHRIVKYAPPQGQTALKKPYIDYHHTITASHAFLLSTGRLEPYPMSALKLLDRHEELWYDLCMTEEVDPVYNRPMSNLVGFHMSDYSYFLSAVMSHLSSDYQAQEISRCAELLHKTIQAVVESQDEKDKMWGYPEHSRPIRSLWVLENISKSSPERFRQHLAGTVTDFCEERQLFRLDLVDQQVPQNLAGAQVDYAYQRGRENMVPSIGLSSCLALLCHRLSDATKESDYFAEQRDDILRYMLHGLYCHPELLLDTTNFTFTWACLGLLNEFFGFIYTDRKEAVQSLDDLLEVRRTDPEYSKQIFSYQWCI